jgi:hypothetical protein
MDTTVIPAVPTPLTMGLLLLILAAATGLMKRFRVRKSDHRVEQAAAPPLERP